MRCSCRWRVRILLQRGCVPEDADGCHGPPQICHPRKCHAASSRPGQESDRCGGWTPDGSRRWRVRLLVSAHGGRACVHLRHQDAEASVAASAEHDWASYGLCELDSETRYGRQRTVLIVGQAPSEGAPVRAVGEDWRYRNGHGQVSAAEFEADLLGQGVPAVRSVSALWMSNCDEWCVRRPYATKCVRPAQEVSRVAGLARATHGGAAATQGKSTGLDAEASGELGYGWSSERQS